MRYIDLITESMQPLPGALNKIRTGFEGTPDASCYNRVGRFLAMNDPEAIQNMVVALYSLPGGDRYTHAAIEMPDGKLVSEVKPPQTKINGQIVSLRDINGYQINPEMQRSTISVSEMLKWLSAGKGGVQHPSQY